MSIALDFAFARPTIKQIQAEGAVGVLRYLTHSQSKAVTRAELTGYLAAGIPVGFVFEDAAARAQQGRAAGAMDGAYARGQLSVLGLPLDTPIYVAVDTDTSWSAVKPYMDGFASMHPHIGVYGGWNIIQDAYLAGIRWLWQTRAWSGGRVHPAACLYQSATVLGGSADKNIIRLADWGQTPRPAQEDTVTPQDIANIVNGVVDGIKTLMRDPKMLQETRDNNAFGELWWLDHALTGVVPDGASKAQADIITRVHQDLKNIGNKS